MIRFYRLIYNGFIKDSKNKVIPCYKSQIPFCLIDQRLLIGFPNHSKISDKSFRKKNVPVYQGTTLESMINLDKNLSLNPTD